MISTRGCMRTCRVLSDLTQQSGADASVCSAEIYRTPRAGGRKAGVRAFGEGLSWSAGWRSTQSRLSWLGSILLCLIDCRCPTWTDSPRHVTLKSARPCPHACHQPKRPSANTASTQKNIQNQ